MLDGKPLEAHRDLSLTLRRYYRDSQIVCAPSFIEFHELLIWDEDTVEDHMNIAFGRNADSYVDAAQVVCLSIVAGCDCDLERIVIGQGVLRWRGQRR